MGFIKEKYSNNRAGLVVSFQGEENTENYAATDSVEEAMQYFHLYLKDDQLYTESDDTIALEKVGIAVEEANELRVLMDEYAASLTNEEALEKMVLFANWSGNAVSYKAEQRIRFNGRLYIVLQDHVSQPSWEPNVANSLFAMILTDEENGIVLDWVQPDSTNGYSVDDMVLHNGMCYKSLIDNNVWEPGVTGSESMWKQVNADGSDIVVGEIDEYSVGIVYNIGDRVMFEGTTYESVIDNNSWSPVDYPAGWTVVQ